MTIHKPFHMKLCASNVVRTRDYPNGMLRTVQELFETFKLSGVRP